MPAPRKATDVLPGVDARDLAALARAMRFAMVCGMFGLAYLNVRTALGLSAFAQIFADMLGGKPLPVLTMWVIERRQLFAALSFAAPVLAVGTLFVGGWVRPFYLLGILSLAMTAQLVVTCFALSMPLAQIITGMTGGQ